MNLFTVPLPLSARAEANCKYNKRKKIKSNFFDIPKHSSIALTYILLLGEWLNFNIMALLALRSVHVALFHQIKKKEKKIK